MSAISYHAAGADVDASDVTPLLSWGDAYDTLDIEDDLIDGLVPFNVGFLAGPPGAGKTQILVAMSAAIATGCDFFGYHIEETGAVVYLTAEGQGMFKVRLRAALEELGKLDAEVDVAVTATTPYNLGACVKNEKTGKLEFNQSMADEGFGQLRAELRAIVARGKHIRLIVVDTLSAHAIALDDSAQKDMAPLVAELQKLQREFGCAVIVAQHFKKGANDMRGSSVLKGNGEFVYMCLPHELQKEFEKEDGEIIRYVTLSNRLQDGGKQKDDAEVRLELEMVHRKVQRNKSGIPYAKGKRKRPVSTAYVRSKSTDLPIVVRGGAHNGNTDVVDSRIIKAMQELGAEDAPVRTASILVKASVSQKQWEKSKGRLSRIQAGETRGTYSLIPETADVFGVLGHSQ
jgi:hypothetical protein